MPSVTPVALLSRRPEPYLDFTEKRFDAFGGKENGADYAPGTRTDAEMRRLTTQARLIDPIQRVGFRSREASRLGCAYLMSAALRVTSPSLVADIVGPGGEVLGTDVSPVAVKTAEARTKSAGLKQDRIPARRSRCDGFRSARLMPWIWPLRSAIHPRPAHGAGKDRAACECPAASSSSTSWTGAAHESSPLVPSMNSYATGSARTIEGGRSKSKARHWTGTPLRGRRPSTPSPEARVCHCLGTSWPSTLFTW